ncbi:MAG: aquaporin [Candidatus Saccharimonadales bacterium]
MFGQKRIAAFVAEFLGGGLLSLALYTILARTSFPIFTGAALALTYALIVMVFGQVSGGHANPAVTLAMWTRSRISTLHAIVSIAAQMLGGFAAWGLIRYFMGHTLTSLAGTKFAWAPFIAEAIGTAVFTFGIGAAVYMKVEGSKLATAAALSLFLGVLVASLGSNGILNPAAALGVQSWDWAYAAGPLVGGIVGINLYSLLFAGDWSNWNKKTATVRVTTSSTSKKKKSSRRR